MPTEGSPPRALSCVSPVPVISSGCNQGHSIWNLLLLPCYLPLCWAMPSFLDIFHSISSSCSCNCMSCSLPVFFPELCKPMHIDHEQTSSTWTVVGLCIYVSWLCWALYSLDPRLLQIWSGKIQWLEAIVKKYASDGSLSKAEVLMSLGWVHP